MFLSRLTPSYIRFLQTQSFQPLPVKRPVEMAIPGMAVLMGPLGIGMCGYSSQQLALYHRPSARVLQWACTHPTTPTNMVGADTQRTPFLDGTRRANHYTEVPPPSFAGEKVAMK